MAFALMYLSSVTGILFYFIRILLKDNLLCAITCVLCKPMRLALFSYSIYGLSNENHVIFVYLCSLLSLATFAPWMNEWMLRGWMNVRLTPEYFLLRKVKFIILKGFMFIIVMQILIAVTTNTRTHTYTIVNRMMYVWCKTNYKFVVLFNETL